MWKNYLKIAFKVFLRRKFFTFISLFAIVFTLLVLILTSSVLDHMLGNHPPESRFNRILGVFRVQLFGEQMFINSSPGYAFLESCLRDLPGAAADCILTEGRESNAYINQAKLPLNIKHTEASFWDMMDFEFLEGGPFGPEDVRQARHVIVINEATRDQYFGGEPATGKFMDLDGRRFRVTGVVANVSRLRNVCFADVWAPLSLLLTDTFRAQNFGSCRGLILVPDPADIPMVKQEFAARVRLFQEANAKEYNRVESWAELYLESIVRESGSFGKAGVTGFFVIIFFMMVLFMFIPTLNLVNINISRIMERESEIGVRKAFGASSRALVVQFVTENVLLTLTGGLVAVVLAFFLLQAINDSGLLPYAQLTVNWRVILAGLALALFFGMMSGVYPAWRMSRLHPAQALRGGER